MKQIILLLILIPTFLYSQDKDRTSKWMDNSIEQLTKAKISKKDKHYLKALVFADKALDNDPKNPEIFFIKGLINQVWGKIDYDTVKFNNAIKNYSTALFLDSTYTNAYLNRGLAYYDIGDYSKSHSDYNKARSYGCSSYAFNYNYALLLQTIHESSQASVWVSFALQMTNLTEIEKIDAYNLRGTCYLEMKEYEKAKADFDSVLVYNAFHSRATMNLALTKSYLKDYESAIELFNKAIELPDNDDFIQFIYNNLANTYLKIEDMDQACKYWKLAIENGYKYDPKWKVEYNIEDPNELIKANCGQ